MRQMVPTAQYPRSRYVAMQVVLFLVLLATVALARWVSLRRQVSIGAGGPIVVGHFELHMPDGWQIVRENKAGATEVAATDPWNTGRQLIATYEVVNQPISPMDYIRASGILPRRWSGQEMMLGGYPGVYIAMLRERVVDGKPALMKDLLACVELPTREILTVQLVGPGAVQAEDEQLLNDFLTALQIKPLPKSIAPPPAPAPPPSSDDGEGV